MKDILKCKKQLKTDPKINSADTLIEKVIELQQRNFPLSVFL